MWVKRLDILLQAAFTSWSSDVHEGGSGHLAYRPTVDIVQVCGLQKRQEDGSILNQGGTAMESTVHMLFLLAKKSTLPCRSEGSYNVGRCLCGPFRVMCVTLRHCSEWANMSVLQDNRNPAREKLRHRQTVFGCPACCLCGRCQALLALPKQT